MVNYECSGMWVKDFRQVAEVFHVDSLVLKHRYDADLVDFRVSMYQQPWDIPIGNNISDYITMTVLTAHADTIIQKI